MPLRLSLTIATLFLTGNFYSQFSKEWIPLDGAESSLAAVVGHLSTAFVLCQPPSLAAASNAGHLLILWQLLGCGYTQNHSYAYTHHLTILTDSQKYVIDVLGRLRWCFQEKEGVLIGIWLRLFQLHHPLVFEVGLVARQSYHDCWRCLSLQLLYPCLCSTKRVLVGDVVHYNGCLRPSVVHGCQTVIPGKHWFVSTNMVLRLHCLISKYKDSL